MTKGTKREIVVEYEQIRIIRKRARTVLANCGKCGCEADFVRIADAAELFDSDADSIVGFANASGGHFLSGVDAIMLCLPSLLASMKTKLLNQNIRTLGE